MMPANTTESKRKLMGSEYIYYLANKKHAGATNIVFSAELQCQDSAADACALLTQKNISARLLDLMKTHYLLNVTVQDDKSKGAPCFVFHSDNATITDDHVEFIEVEEKISTNAPAETNTNDPFQRHFAKVVDDLNVYPLSSLKTPPYVRVCALVYNGKDENGNLVEKRFGLAVAVLHTIADLMASATIYTELVTLIFSSAPCEEAMASNAASISKPNPPPTSVDIKPKNRKGIVSFLFRGGMKWMGEFGKIGAAGKLTAFKPDLEVKDGHQTVTVRVDTATATALKAKAKQLGIKMHGIVTAAVILAHKKEILINPNEEMLKTMKTNGLVADKQGTSANSSNAVNVTLYVASPVDTRRRASPPLPPKTVASLSFGMASNHVAFDLTQDSLAQCKMEAAPIFQQGEFDHFAKQSHNDFHDMISQGTFWFSASMVDSVPPSLARRMMEKKEYEEFDGSIMPFTLGNVGVLDESSLPNGVQLLDVAAHFHANPGGIYITIITTKCGGMAFGITGETLSFDHRKRYGEDIVSVLRSVADM